MKVSELLNYLQLFDNDDELEIEVYETISRRYIDSTADIVVDEEAQVPTLRIDVEKDKLLGH